MLLRRRARALKASKAKQSHALPKYPTPSTATTPAGSAFRGISHPPQPSAELAFAANLTGSTCARHWPTRGSHPQGKGCAKGLTTPSAESNGEEYSKFTTADVRSAQATIASDCSLLPAGHRTAARQRFPCVFGCGGLFSCHQAAVVPWAQWLGLGVGLTCAKNARTGRSWNKSRRGHLRRRTMLWS